MSPLPKKAPVVTLDPVATQARHVRPGLSRELSARLGRAVHARAALATQLPRARAHRGARAQG